MRVCVAQWWASGARRSKVLGRCVQMSQSEAQTALAAILRPINEGTAPAARPALTFNQFIHQVYLPHCKRTWKASGELTMVPIINNHLSSAFGNRLLTTITRQQMQDLLDAKALVLSKNVVSHLRWYLNAIFKLAWSDGVVEHNPAAELRVPKCCKACKEVRPLTEEEVERYLGVLGVAERLMARLAIFEGLRPGEILALRWGAFDGDAVRIRQRVYQGGFDTPKNGKQRESALSDGTIALVRTWREVARSTLADALVFLENPASPLI
jgi:integrase